LLGDKGLIGKALLVTQTPLDKRGEGFLLWQTERANDSQAWLYLPDLRQVRRLAIAGHEHHEHGSRQRPPQTDSNSLNAPRGYDRQLVGKEVDGGQTHPRRPPTMTMTCCRCVASGSRLRIGRSEKSNIATPGRVSAQRITWERLDQGRVWKRTEIQPAGTPGKTIVELSDISVNTGLADRLFTVETLKAGRAP
jgi:hypothetical protein